MALRALMLDVDGVLVTSPNGKLWNWNVQADLGLDPGLFAERFFAPHWPDILLGRADLHERLAPVLAEIAPHLTSQQVADYWFAKDSHVDERLLADLALLRAEGPEQHLATLQDHHRARYLWESMGFRDRFDAMHYAADLGSAKPDPSFFAEIERRTGFAPEELLLIDDKAANVEGARKAGWRGALWDGSRRLAEVLAEAGG
jgi:putative hydrolase of the HAD superfamily